MSSTHRAPVRAGVGPRLPHIEEVVATRLPYDRETLDTVTRHLREVQDGLGRPYLLENPSSYVGFAGSTMTETEFLNELVDRTGCQVAMPVWGSDARRSLMVSPSQIQGEVSRMGA